MPVPARASASLVRAVAAALLVLVLAVFAAHADDIPTTPILRIETGMHGAAINALAVDPADQLVVTASDDKTARVWSSAGDLLATLRGPIGDGPEGGLYAAAVSPSGKTIAVGGYTGLTWDQSSAIYLFNRADGSWLGRVVLGAGSDVVNRLVFSPDGHYLAVATNDRRGLRVLDTRALTVKMVDDDYADAIEGLDFAKDGRLVAASLDGGVRLYDPSFHRVATYRVPDRHKPLTVAFAPDGSAVAVGMLDASEVLLLSERDLKRTGALKGGDGHTGALSVAAWSADGGFLYAAGTYGDAAGHKFLRRWAKADPAKAMDIAASDDTITALAALGQDMVFAGAEPVWGIVAPDGTIALRHDRAFADFRDGEDGFLVSADGSAVAFGFAQGGKTRARFDVTAGTLTLDPAATPDLKPPAAEGFADWRNGDKPRLDGHVVPLDANEKARSAAVLGQHALLGTDFFLRAYSDGHAAWKTAVPAPAWVVNVAADGRLAVAGLGDGTIRWYRLADGALILSLFAEPDGKHWVAWTPEGFFDHGEGGDQLIGYHLNQVADGKPKGAAFIRVEQLYALFFRRDLVVKKFMGRDEDEIASELQRIGDVRSVLAKGLPPEIRLSDYCFGADCQPVGPDPRLRGGKIEPRETTASEVTLHFDVLDRGGGIGPITVRNRGATVAAPGQTRGIKGNVQSEERVVQLQPGLNVLMVSALNGAQQIETGLKERPALILRYDPSVTQKPTMRLLAVGVNKYAGAGIPPLANAAADAQGVADVLRGDKKHDVYADVDAIVLTDGQATLANIDKALADLAGRTKPDDLVFVFFAGHGVALDGKYFYIPVDLPNAEPDTIRKGAVTYDDLARRLGSFPTSRTLIVLDTCYSGAFAVDDSILRDSRDDTVAKQMSHATGRFILAGSSSQEEALDGIDGHGVFTQSLITGLSGAADTSVAGNHDGKVSIYELGEYAKANVPALAAKIANGYSQKPRWYFNGDDMFDLRDAN